MLNIAYASDVSLKFVSYILMLDFFHIFLQHRNSRLMRAREMICLKCYLEIRVQTEFSFFELEIEITCT